MPIKDLTKASEFEKEPTINKVIERLYTANSELTSFINNPDNARHKKGVGFARVLKKNSMKDIPKME